MKHLNLRERSRVSKCPYFKRGWDPNAPACQHCNRDFRGDYVACRKAVLLQQMGEVDRKSLVATDLERTIRMQEIEKEDERRSIPREGRIAKLLGAGGNTVDDVFFAVKREYKYDNKGAKELRRTVSHIAKLLKHSGTVIEDDEHRLWPFSKHIKWCCVCRKHEGQIMLGKNRYCYQCAEKEIGTD